MCLSRAPTPSLPLKIPRNGKIPNLCGVTTNRIHATSHCFCTRTRTAVYQFPPIEPSELPCTGPETSKMTRLVVSNFCGLNFGSRTGSVSIILIFYRSNPENDYSEVWRIARFRHCRESLSNAPWIARLQPERILNVLDTLYEALFLTCHEWIVKIHCAVGRQ